MRQMGTKIDTVKKIPARISNTLEREDMLVVVFMSLGLMHC